ncbi:hypothetical protein NEILACOT_03371 [Neisseria lactamica ATCC 23970]|uniref:Uncharacterized protein n=1 Tax=Neisseria lactamica ATCC 23970 TaxID=546265 RepID=D0W774_NEILA|nr:hypothetical protein NEILACOT_03371 [Neisseria lactamica ATCC 23970]EFH22644.1 hypothetical protein NEIPOLOT_01551 [Neisseria polysaccharea ATCC 43768]
MNVHRVSFSVETPPTWTSVLRGGRIRFYLGRVQSLPNQDGT